MRKKEREKVREEGGDREKGGGQTGLKDGKREGEGREREREGWGKRESE